ncbi:flavonol synthase/flavanone 3-hydroxylase-like [Chenopodium quinoa]|uniref:Fe2OG dioxygenase domain-containing protein n=1 Tax=Chenopodium quinoa TaxID=63459 RepID=A0A803L0A7_CHEQI|nr:flavonol synthase/flavanone 3-hydroxylase-like [Chenopodium quinoa]
MEVEKVQNIALKFNNNNSNSSRIIEESSIPKEFIRSENEQPAITTVHGTELEVPTIDLSEANEDELVDLISKASEEWGLFQVVNHGIPTQVIQDLQKAGRDFFELPQEEKEVYSKPPPGYKGSEGYSNKLGKNIDTVRPWVDHLFHNIWPPSAINFHFWPKNPPSYRKANEEYAKYLIGVTEKLMKCWSKGLGLEEHKIREGGGGDEMVYLAKINYYPPCPRPELALGVPAHTDLSLLTILVPNDVAGLQVCRDGLWYNVRYIPNALIIHIGDQLEVLSNGKYKAVLHRTTVNKEKTRMSWPVFIEPPPHHEVGPVPELITENNPAKYKTKKFADYKYCKLNKLPQ